MTHVCHRLTIQMGNSQRVDKELIKECWDKEYNLKYPLTGKQSQALFELYDGVLHHNKKYTHTRKITQNIQHLCSIGYYEGEIIAFGFQGTKKPFIIFKCDNDHYKESYRVLKKSYEKSNRNNKGYEQIPSELSITVIRIHGVVDQCKDFQWVVKVIDKEECEQNELAEHLLQLKINI